MIQADFKCIPFLRCVGRLNRRVLVLITLGLWGKKKAWVLMQREVVLMNYSWRQVSKKYSVHSTE